MGIFSKPKAPAPLDANKVIGAQDQAIDKNVGTQVDQNRINQYGPFGSVTFDANGNQTTTLDPAERAKREQMWGAGYGAYQSGLSALGNSSNLDPSLTDPTGLLAAGAGRMHGMTQDQFAAPDWQEAADRTTQFMRLTQGEQRDALDNKLRNQGLAPGTEAYDRALRDQKVAGDLAVNTATAGVQNQLYNQALGARGQNWTEGTQAAQLGLGAGAQDWTQKFGLAGLGSQDAARMAQLGLSGMPAIATSPGVSSYSNVNVPFSDPANAYGMAQADAWKQFDAQQKQQQALLGGLGALGGQGLGWGMGTAPTGGFGATNFGKMFGLGHG